MQDSFEILIPSGRLKGRKISILSSNTTRSTKAIVAASLFNTLRYELQNAVFAELFGGCAMMAIRSISEGASTAFVFEKNKQSFDVIKKNIFSLGLEDSICANFGDTFILAPKILQKIENLILYVDPPFNIRDGFDKIYEKSFELVSEINSNIIIFEHISDIKIPQKINNLTLKKSKKFGKTTLSYFFKN